MENENGKKKVASKKSEQLHWNSLRLWKMDKEAEFE